jgi:valyl-tRNA synthetase
MADKWPVVEQYDEISAGQFDKIKELVVEGRWIIAELPGNEKYGLLFGNDSLIEQNQEVISHLMRLKEITKIDQPRGLRLAAANREAWLDIDSETLYEHQTNLETRLAAARTRQKGLQSRLDNPSYIEKAPEKLVQETKDELIETDKLIKRLTEELSVIQLD